MLKCFGPEISKDRKERCHRFIEEALELVQAGDCSKEDVLMLVDYVYSRPKGEVYQEVGGVIVTLAAFCTAWNQDLELDAVVEQERIWTKVKEICEKQATKPGNNSPLPE